MDLFRIAGHDLDEHIGQNAEADRRGDIAGEGAEHDHDERAKAAFEVGEIQLGKPGEHGESDKDQSNARDGGGDHEEKGREENADEEQNARDN